MPTDDREITSARKVGGASGTGSQEAASTSSSEELDELLKSELAPKLRVMRRLSHGPMASVYLAREPELKRLVAVKVLSPRLAKDPRARKRFEREAQSAASVSHPNIVEFHWVERLSNDIPYFVMQYVKGRTLADRLRAEGKFSVEEGCRVLAEVASALAAAHKKGIVHRDVTPVNILYEEETGRAVVTDFGIVALLATGDSEEAIRLTKSGEVMGDPAYLSPEQLMGRELTERSDVYGLGLLGYELIAGRGPYDATSRKELYQAHLREGPRKLSELTGEVSAPLDELLLRCLAKEPDHRPNASDVAERLLSLRQGRQDRAAVERLEPTSPSKIILSKLGERRLVQYVAVYAGAGWLLLQVIDQLVQQEILSKLAYQLTLVSVIAGLPAAFTLAWFHGKAGPQRFHRLEFVLLGAVLLIWLSVVGVMLLD